MGKKTPSAGKGWKDKYKSQKYLDNYDQIDWSKKSGGKKNAEEQKTPVHSRHTGKAGSTPKPS